MPVRTTPAVRVLVAILIVAAGSLAWLQLHDTPRPHRIGLLGWSPSAPGPNSDAFFQALRNLGYVEGQNIELHGRTGEGQEGLARAARELAAMNLDVIVALGPPAARAATQATSTIPVVIATGDAVEQGLVASLNRPGGNVTGWTLRSSESGGKQLALLKEALPGISRVAVIANPAMPGQGALVRSLRDSAKQLGLELYPLDVSDEDGLTQAFARMRNERNPGIFRDSRADRHRSTAWPHRRVGRGASHSGHVPISHVRRRRRPHVVRPEPARHGRTHPALRRSHPQGRRSLPTYPSKRPTSTSWS